MSVEQFRAFIDHAYWGRDKILDELEGVSDEALASDPPTEGLRSVIDLMSHMMRFERLFSSQILAEELREIPAGLASVTDLRSAWEPIESAWRRIAEALTPEELDRVVHLQWPDGSEASQAVRAIMAQFVQHQGQHRSELAVIATHLGRSPGECAWWVYLKERDEQVAGRP